MPTSAVLLVLASAVLHACWNTLLHRSSDPPAAVLVSYLGSGLVLLPALVLDPPTGVLGWAVLSALAHAFYLNMLGSAYREGSLSVAYPIARGTAPLLIGLGGWVFLSETPSTATTVGLSCWAVWPTVSENDGPWCLPLRPGWPPSDTR